MLDTILQSLKTLYLEDSRPWLVGFSGGKDSTLVAQLIFEALRDIPVEKRTKNVAVVCTDTRVEIPAIAETISGTLKAMQKYSNEESLGITTHLLRPHRLLDASA